MKVFCWLLGHKWRKESLGRFNEIWGAIGAEMQVCERCGETISCWTTTFQVKESETE